MNNSDHPAFPVSGTFTTRSFEHNKDSGMVSDQQVMTVTYSYDGLTKREYFAAMAMQGLLAYKGDVIPDIVVEKAVLTADYLLKEIEKTNPENK